MVKCKFCPLSEISLRREASSQEDKKKFRKQRYKRYCRFYDKHVDPHINRECETGDNAIKKRGPNKLYPFT